jgi:hypothetical protein
VLEASGDGDEEDEDEELKDESSFEEGVAGGNCGGGVIRVGGLSGAVRGEGLDGGGDAYEGGDNAAWVDWREVRNVVEDAGEDDIVG